MTTETPTVADQATPAGAARLEVVATITTSPGRADAVVAIVHEYLEAVRAETGCVRYDLYRVKRDPDTLVMPETWASKNALRAHGTAAHFVEMSGRLGPELAGPPVVRVLDPAAVSQNSP